MSGEGHSAVGWAMPVYLILPPIYWSKVCSFWQWAVANCSAVPTANAGQYPLQFVNHLLCWFPCKCPDLWPSGGSL